MHKIFKIWLLKHFCYNKNILNLLYGDNFQKEKGFFKMKIVVDVENLDLLEVESFQKIKKTKKSMAVENSYTKFLSRKRDKKNAKKRA